MSEIHILSPHVADLIAAGEVVERPGSVIKELLENAFDAGASAVTVELTNGGMTLIRVRDDGKGMAPEDAGLAFMRHATSKLAEGRDLEAIGTFGFRGEALAAVAAVSRIELTTRQKGAADGVRMALEAGDILEMEPCGCPPGTTIVIRDLFFNTPARLKFMKSDRAEGAACVSAALRCALGRPGISVRCLRDGKEEFFSPGDGRLQSAVYSLLGRETASSMLACKGADEAVAVTGFVSSPAFCRGNRGLQFFYVNGRSVRSTTLQAALEQAYRNRMLPGRFPACVLHIDLSFAAVDVNVHPAKTEVKFSDEKKVFDAVYYAVAAALEERGETAEIQLSSSTAALASPRRGPQPDPTGRSAPPVLHRSAPHQERPAAAPMFRETHHHGYTPRPLTQPEGPQAQRKEAPKAPEAPPQPSFFASDEPAFRLVGEALETYIVVETGGELLLIDKHAAHERILFDKLKKEGRELMSQALLTPLTLSLPRGDLALIFENQALFSRLGFEIEPYGDEALVIRALPAGTDPGAGGALLEELAEKLKRKGSLAADELMDSLLRSIACKAAIKAQSASQPAELIALAGRVVRGEVQYCPHGRPLAAALTKRELDKLFKRIV